MFHRQNTVESHPMSLLGNVLSAASTTHHLKMLPDRKKLTT
jgi:hypothetical protein